jgi:transcriptional regulator with XRE-family HTH domain
MPRRRLEPSYDKWLTEGWVTFGKWLRERRIGRRFSLQQAADAVGVTRRQWIRYEKGAKVPDKRLDRIALKLHIERRRIYYMAGFQVPKKNNDVPALLRRMHVMMQTGDLYSALQLFLKIYLGMRIKLHDDELEMDATTPACFAGAIISLEALPQWLFQTVLQCMQEKKEQSEGGTNDLSFRRIIYNQCLDELSDNPPIVKERYAHLKGLVTMG